LIRAIRKIRIQKAFSCLVPARPGWDKKLKICVNLLFSASPKLGCGQSGAANKAQKMLRRAREN
jgi:hypothetical protein